MTDAPAPPFRRRARRWFLLGLLGLVLAVAAFWALPWVYFRFSHSISKDAFVESHLINVAPQVAGTVVEINVQEQERVRKGQLLAVIDPTTYRREVELAAAKLNVAEAVLRKVEADLALLTAEVPKRVHVAAMKLAIAKEDEAKAGEARQMVGRDSAEAVKAANHAIEGARATLALAEEDFNRYTGLYRDGSVTQRRMQEATKIHKTALRRPEGGRGSAGPGRGQPEAGRHCRAAVESFSPRRRRSQRGTRSCPVGHRPNSGE